MATVIFVIPRFAPPQKLASSFLTLTREGEVQKLRDLEGDRFYVTRKIRLGCLFPSVVETAKTLDDSVAAIREMVDAAKSEREDVLLLCHGGPLAMPEDAQRHT